MSEPSSVLLVSDGVSDEDEAVRQALNQARHRSASLRVLVLCPEFPGPLAAHQESYRELLREKVQKDIKAGYASTRVEEGEVPYSVEVQVTATPVVDAIRYLLRHDCALLVKQAEQPAGRTGFLAVDMDLLRKCPSPVWLARAIERPSPQIRVGTAIDPGKVTDTARELSIELLRQARAIADDCDGTLNILSCWDFPQEEWLRSRIPNADLTSAVFNVQNQHREELEALIQQADITGPIHIEHVRGQPGRALPVLVTGLDLDILVMGTVARTGITNWLMGNTAEDVFHELNCSLLALKPGDYVTPIRIE